MASYTDLGVLRNTNYSFETKKKALEKMLNDLLEINEIKNSKELREFLNLPDSIPEKESIINTNLRSEIIQ